MLSRRQFSFVSIRDKSILSTTTVNTGLVMEDEEPQVVAPRRKRLHLGLRKHLPFDHQDVVDIPVSTTSNFSSVSSDPDYVAPETEPRKCDEYRQQVAVETHSPCVGNIQVDISVIGRGDVQSPPSPTPPTNETPQPRIPHDDPYALITRNALRVRKFFVGFRFEILCLDRDLSIDILFLNRLCSTRMLLQIRFQIPSSSRFW